MSQIKVNRWLITLAASLGWLFGAYIVAIYPLSVPLIATELSLPSMVLSRTTGWIFLVGYTIGTIGSGVCADIFGRRIMPGLSTAAYAFVTALTSLAIGLHRLAICRSSMGIDDGGELSIGSPYVTEVWPKEGRGTGIGLVDAFYPEGDLLPS
jgi:MFS transporter, putative metabolite:H+ symporter